MVAFQAEDLNGCADGDALYFGTVPFCLRSDMNDVSAQVDSSASCILPISQGWIQPNCEPDFLLWWWILSLLSWWMSGVKGCSFEGRHQRAVKALWEGRHVTCVDCWGRQVLLIGNKLKCCFPVGSSPSTEGDINRRLDCKSYHACKLVMVVYSSLNNLRQFLSRVLWSLTNTSVKKTWLEGVPYSPRAKKWRAVGLETKSWSLFMSAHNAAALPQPAGPPICWAFGGEICDTSTWIRLCFWAVFKSMYV